MNPDTPQSQARAPEPDLSPMMEEDPAPAEVVAEPSSKMAPLRLEYRIQQGLSEDTTSLRANDRTAKMFVDIHCASEELCGNVKRLLAGDTRDGEDSYARLSFELCYADGGEVELIGHSKHSEHIDVMEPSGAGHTRRKIHESVFAMDSRAHRDKRVGNGARSFYSALHLDHSIAEDGTGRVVRTECKFSTNITSRQHERQNFIWKTTFTMCLAGEIVEASEQTPEFEYVARRLKTPAPKRKRPTPYDRPKKTHSPHPLRGEDSDSDQGLPTVEEGPPMIRRSTRKAAAVCRENTAELIAKETSPSELLSPGSSNRVHDADGDYMDPSRHRPSYAPNPLLASVTPRPGGGLAAGMSIEDMFGRPAPRAADEELLRNPSAGGRNLSRVESIDCMFDRLPAQNTLASSSLARNLPSSSLALSRGLSALGQPGLERKNSGLNLARCNSSTWSLFSVGEEDLMEVSNAESSGHDSGDSGFSAPNPMLINA